jgi:FAD/FMN-containing dehydrogenase
VRSAVLLAAEHPDLPFSVCSGGHGVSGRSTNHGGIVLDLAAMNDIVLADPGRGLVRVEPGAQWLDVARTLEPHGLGISSGDYGGVGVGGLATTIAGALLPASLDSVLKFLPSSAGAAFTTVTGAGDEVLSPTAGALVLVGWVALAVGASVLAMSCQLQLKSMTSACRY